MGYTTDYIGTNNLILIIVGENKNEVKKKKEYGKKIKYFIEQN